MKLCLKALIKQVTKLHRAYLEVCHYAEGFTLRRICPLGRQEKLAVKCLWFVISNRNPSAGKTLSSSSFKLVV
jgi:hypothetical protein